MDKIEALLKVKQLKDLKVDVPGFNKNLLKGGEFPPHQAIGISFLTIAGKGMLLDPVGSGKTVMSIAADLKLRSLGRHTRTIVGCMGTTRDQWASEYRRWTNLSVGVISGQKADRYRNWLTAHNCDITIAAYESIRNDLAIVKDMRYDVAIWDEASYFKNPETKVSAALEELRDFFKNIFILTATPIQNSLEDLFSIVRKMDPTIIGMDLDQFRERYVVREQFTTRFGGRVRFFWKTMGFKNEQELAQVIFPYYLKRSRQELFGNGLTRQRIERKVELTNSQRLKYKELVDSVQFPSDAAEGHAKKTMLEVFSKLEQCCDTISVFDKDKHDSSKLDDLMFLLENDLSAEKVVVFSKFHGVLTELKRRLQEAEIGFVSITGKESNALDPHKGMSQREENRLKFFDDPKCRICMITTSGEMGLNLHAASYMVFLNHIYNPAREEQIFGRIDRPMVQTADTVTAIHYITKETIEEGLMKRIEERRQLADKVFGQGHESFVHAMSASQLFNLIKSNDVNVGEVVSNGPHPLVLPG